MIWWLIFVLRWQPHHFSQCEEEEEEEEENYLLHPPSHSNSHLIYVCNPSLLLFHPIYNLALFTQTHKICWLLSMLRWQLHHFCLCGEEEGEEVEVEAEAEGCLLDNLKLLYSN